MQESCGFLDIVDFGSLQGHKVLTFGDVKNLHIF